MPPDPPFARPRRDGTAADRRGGRDTVTGFYGRYADLYDRIATLPVVRRWRRRAAAALALDPGDTVVEVGCGTGANVSYLRERVGPGGRVVGVDLTGPLLRRTRRRARLAGWENAAVVRGDATRPPVERADAVLASFVVGLLADPGDAVRTWCDLVGSSGRVAVLDGAPSDHPVGRLLNPAFGAFVGAGAPAPTLSASARQALAGAVGAGPRASLARKVTDARRALTDRTTDRRFETFGLGVIGLLSGRV